MTDLAATAARPWWRRLTPVRDLWIGLFLQAASRIRHGSLTLNLPDGRSMTVGNPAAGPNADLTLDDPAAARHLVLGGDIGLAEAYGDGLWRTTDLPALIELGIRNEAELGDSLLASRLMALVNRLHHRLNDNTRGGSRRNIAAHYDLGNAFYRLWLDPGMTYSSALYERPDQSLEDAQDAKIRRVGDLLELSPGQRVLEIGCGWGGMADHLVRARGASVVGLTLSTEQLAIAQDRLADAPPGMAEFRLQDYRDVDGRFDRIVSIEMIEAVGEAHWPRYFATLRDRLAPGGCAVIQAITIDDSRFDGYRRGCDFIQRHIFPGGMLPSPAVMRAQAAKAGLTIDHVETFGLSYADTLAEWRRRFLAAWPQIAAQGFDARFGRLWEYYLAYCEAGFRAGTIDVGLWRFRRA